MERKGDQIWQDEVSGLALFSVVTPYEKYRYFKVPVDDGKEKYVIVNRGDLKELVKSILNELFEYDF